MFAKSYINNILLPRVELNVGPPKIAGTFNGSNEFIDVHNPSVIDIFNNETVTVENGDYNNPFGPSGGASGVRWFIVLWYKFTEDNTAGNDSVLLHNGLAGNHAFKIYKEDGSEDLKIFVGDGDGDGNVTLTCSDAAKYNEWTMLMIHSYWKYTDSERHILANWRRSALSTSTSSELTDIYTSDNTTDHFTLGCYREGIDNTTAANFFNGQIANVACWVEKFISTGILYNYGMGYDYGNYNLIAPYLVMNMQFGDETISQRVDGSDNDGGGKDGDDDLILFDSTRIRKSARSDRASNKGIQGSMASGDFTLTNGFSVVSGGGLDGTLLRTGSGQTSSGVATFDGFTPVVGRLYKVEITYNVTTASGDGNDTITFAGSTIYSGTGNTTVVTTTKWIKASNTNKLVITAHSDSDATTTISVINFRIWEYDKYGIMVNMTKSSNIGRIVQGPQGGHITP